MEKHCQREKVIAPLAGVLILLAAFVLLYQPWRLGERELFRLEGLYAAQTLEMDYRLPLSTAHGIAIQNAFPLYPYLSKLVLGLTGLPVEFAMRLVSVAMTALASVLIYLTTMHSRSHVAAQAAAATYFAVNIIFDKTLDASPVTTVAFGLLGAQLLWFYFGVERANWNAAWLTSLTALALTFYAGGFTVLLFFFFPLIFMRRPLTLWAKLDKPGLIAGIVIFAGMVLLWAIPYLVFSRIMPFLYWDFGTRNFVAYLEQLLTFPRDLLFRFLPWTLLAWAPFCVALQPIDETPIFSRYLRTIFIASFFLFWLLPGTEAQDLCYLAGPLAILNGLYYENAVRRYGKVLRFFGRCGGFAVLAMALLLIAFCFLPENLMERFISLTNSIEFRHATPYLARTLLAAAALLLIALTLLTGSRRRPVWLVMLLIMVGTGIFFWQSIHVYRIQDRSKSELGGELRQALTAAGAKPDGKLVIYKSDILDLYGECRYLDAKVQKLTNIAELPKSADTVYLLSTEFPQQPDRNWTNLLAPDRTYLRHRICLWKGVLRRDSDTPKVEEDDEK